MLLPIIETERLFLRMYQTEDLESVYLLFADKDVTKFFPSYYTADKEDVLTSMPRRVERWRKFGFGQLGVFDKTDEKLIGYCGLQYLDNTNEVEIYYGLNKNYWGKSLAPEAAQSMLRFGFEQIKLESIVAVTHPENCVSQKVLLKLGFKQAKNARFYEVEAAYFTLSKSDCRRDEAALYKLKFEEIN